MFLYEELKKVDAQRASELHPNDKRRIMRALEVAQDVSGSTDVDDGEELEKLEDAGAHVAAASGGYCHTLVLEREGRMALAQSCFDFLKTRGELDLGGWGEQDIFSHK